MPIIKASVVQTCTQGYGTPDCLELTLKKLDELAGVAKQRDGAQLAVFPEAFIGGYPCENNFGAVVGARTASQEGLLDFKAYYNQAIEVPSPATDKVAAIAKKHDIFLVIGVIERVVGTLYCCAIFVHPQKGLLGKHRKLVPTAAERLVWGYGDATTLPVLEEKFMTADAGEVSAKISATICWYFLLSLSRTVDINTDFVQGELHASPPYLLLLEGRSNLLRTHRRFPPRLATHYDQHRPRRPLLCPRSLPIHAAETLPGRISHRA